MVNRERFLAKIDRTGECWLWTGATHRLGYGQVWVGDDIIRANGRRGQMRQVLHRCDIRACVNPAHLWLGTQADNMADASGKGRTPIGTRHPRALAAEVVVSIRACVASGESHRAVAARHHVSLSTVSRLVNGLRHHDSWERPNG